MLSSGKSKEKYIELWKNHFQEILNSLTKNAKTKHIILYREEFKAVGDRVKSGYSFKLVIKNGEIENDISHSAVARDLAKVLLNSFETKRILITGKYIFNLNSKFQLKICQSTD